MQTTTAAKYDRILHLERALQLSTAVQAFTTAGTPDFRKAQQDEGKSADQARLAEAIDALTPTELAEFGAYRAAALNA